MSLPRISVSQSPESKFQEFLRSRPKSQRYTDQQREMVRFIFERHNHFDAEQLIDDMKRAKCSISRATVYRTLKKLVEAGLLRELNVGPRTFYEHDYGYPQHEHLYCQQCQKMIEFQADEINKVIEQVCLEHNFQTQGHTFIIRGLCSDCNRARVNKRRLDLI
ncbi:MAG: transcriptional repressor [Gemmatales bacterium]|nr:MAG: transcriptional repressor [Gemmatales bacterium]